MIQTFFRQYKEKLTKQSSIIIQKYFRMFFYRKRYLNFLIKIKLLQRLIRIFLKKQNKLKFNNKKLLNELKITSNRLQDLKEKHKKDTSILQYNLTKFKSKVKKTLLEKKKTETELKFLEDGMKRSINEKMILSRKLEELMIENDRIRNMKQATVIDNCIVM